MHLHTKMHITEVRALLKEKRDRLEREAKAKTKEMKQGLKPKQKDLKKNATGTAKSKQNSRGVIKENMGKTKKGQVLKASTPGSSSATKSSVLPSFFKKKQLGRTGVEKVNCLAPLVSAQKELQTPLIDLILTN